MKSLVLYDSLYGNTKLVAEEIAKTIHGKAVNLNDFTVKEDAFKDISLLIVGSPIQGWLPSKSTKEFLSSLPKDSLEGKAVAAFETRLNMFLSGSAADKILNFLRNLGGTPAAKPGKFVVKGAKGPLAEGELEKAADWAKQIVDNLDYAKPHPHAM